MKSDECDEMCRIVLNRVEIGFGLNSGARGGCEKLDAGAKDATLWNEIGLWL